MRCFRCGQENLDDSIYCNKCGEKIDKSIVLVNNENRIREYNTKKLRIRKFILGFISLIILFAIGAGGGYLYFKKIENQKYQAYYQNYTVNFMKATKGILLEKKITSLMCSVVSETWSSSIESRYKDFNDELIELNKRWSRNGFLKSREDAKNKIELEMSQLKNPPNDYKEAYNTLVELYGYYSQIYNQSVSPKGSLITYNQDVNNKTGEFDKIYDKLAIIKPDIKLIDMDEPDDSKDNLNQLNTNIVKNKFQSIDNNKNITSNEAVDIVKRFFPQLNSDAIIEYDHTENINGKDYYVVHIYSIVNNHTATVGWYCVDTNTGKAYEWNLANGTLAILS